MLERTVTHLAVGRRGVVARRSFLKTLAAGSAGAALWSWQDMLLAAAPQLRKHAKAVIVLWMQGGPTQFETFDPKPGVSDGCMTGVIDTAVPGIQIADFWPEVAKQMKHIALVRSMTSKEGNHIRATYQFHTGYVPSGTLKHPSFGSLVTKELGDPDSDLPGFVSISGPSAGSGFLPVAYGPFRVLDPSELPSHSIVPVPTDRFDRRLELMGRLESHFAGSGARRRVEDHRGVYHQAARLAKSPKLSAFDISKEKPETREKYGDDAFGQGCLLARRLVEAGVTYIEVSLGNWDTHQDNHDRVQSLAERCDKGYAALLADLAARGLLDRTLVVWMGEFGRTPRINPNGGRDHFPRAFNVALSGCGVRGGQAVGKTSSNGSEVAERPVGVADLFCTMAKTLGIDPAKENQSPVGRPLKIVDGGAVIEELFA